MKELKYSWSHKLHLTECPLHDKGPQVILQLKQATTAHARAEAEQLDAVQAGSKDVLHRVTLETAKCLKEVRELRDKVSHYHTHCAQYKVCRAVVNQIENNLQPGTGVLYRDYVAQYVVGGGKVSNLVLVLLYHNGVSVQRHDKVMKFNHMCQDPDSRSQDAYFTADVWHWFLGKSGVLKRNGIHTLYVTGDHGPHFASIQIMWFESTLYDLYGIRIHMFFLCSYHSYNRCDGAGTETKRLHAILIGIREATPQASELAHGINESEHHNSVGVYFEKINRGDKVFNVQLVKANKLMLRPQCEVKYD